jgi:hypothetical protein
MSTIPLSGTNIRLLSGIPFNSDYKNTRWFDSLTEQTNWFLSRNVVHSISEANFQRIEGHTFISVNKSIDELWNTGYVMFQNASYNNKWFYGFVTKLEYVQRNTTYVHFEIDVMQTWVFNVRFLPSFVVREHCPLWNSDGTPVINTVDEGLNYGSEYQIANVQQYRAYDNLYFMVIISKTALHDGSAGSYINSLNGLPQNLVYYVHPFHLDGSVPASNVTLTQQVGAVINAMYLSQNAVNNIVSIYVSDMLPDNPFYDGTTINFDLTAYEHVTIGAVDTIHVKSVNYSTWIKDLGNKYDGFTQPSESKLLMYPYTVTVIDDFKGNRIELKNEYIQNTDLILNVRGSLGVSNKTVYSVKDYLNGSLTDDGIKEKVSMEHALIDSNPNDLPVMTDNLSAFIQGNRNSLANQKSQIGFNGLMDAMKSAVGIGQAVVDKNPLGGVNAGLQGVQSVGNAYFDTQALMAKQQDIKNVPPQLAKMGGNAYFDFGHGYVGVWVIKKEITEEYRKKLTDFFNMYGYKKNEVKLPNVHTRQNWNYIQTKGIILTSDINNQDLQILKNIFDNGVTLWHTDDIGNYGLQNGVI